MIDRYGNRLAVGWSEVEMLWLEAALALPKNERMSAYQDIAAMSTRPALSIQRMAHRVAMLKRDEELRRMRLAPRQVKRADPLPPSQIVATRKQLMAGRSTYSPTTGMR